MLEHKLPAQLSNNSSHVAADGTTHLGALFKLGTTLACNYRFIEA